MNVYRKNTGEKYTPFDHFDMQTQVIFNAEGGCSKANITLTTLPKSSGSNDEIHPNSDQIFYILQGTMKLSAHGNLLHTLNPGDAIMVEAGETHAVINDEEEDVIFIAITVPPLEQTH
ncbi:cupin domain-containing protein [Thermodesulfobacteriota bacterium]